MAIDDKQIRNYLLGSAAEHDDEEIGLLLIADKQFAKRLDHAENDLVEDYLDNLLSDNDKRLFGENFLVSAERRDLMRELRMLRAAVRDLSSSPADAKQASKAAKTSYFSLFFRPLLAAAGLFGILFAGFFIWYSFVRDSRTPLEIEYAALNRRDLTDPAKTSGLFVINLIPANFRDNASTASHAAAGLTDSIVFRLALMAPTPEGTELDASIVKSGKRVFTVPGRVFRSAFGSELRFMAPRDVLSPGQYEIEVRSSDSRQVNSRYQLRIE